VVGQVVSHYKVLQQLGSGGMGVVYEAEDMQLGRKVALKFLPESLARDSHSLERFQREARAASAMNHPNVCTVYSIEQHQGQHFIVMELLEGSSLSEMMKKQRLDMEQVLAISIQIADAMESAHSKGIVHRDIKPANIFVSPKGQVKVLDFGLAKFDFAQQHAAAATAETAAFSELTSPGVTVGTVAYMSPEQARGQLTDSRTDLFSFGTVLYQMATGTLPFQGETSAVIFESILSREPLPLVQVNPSLPLDLQRIIDKALEKDRSLRYQTATEFKTDLLRLKRDLESGNRRVADSSDGRKAASTEKSLAVLYFENLSGVKEDEYFRDGMTEDIITELSKIKGLKVFSRPTVLAYRDVKVTVSQIGQQLNASYVLAGSLRRSGNRLRINAQLVDAKTDFPLWSERYDREMKDVFEVQDEIARKIAEALRITISPQERDAIADRPTENLQAYDLYLRGKSYARRFTRQDLEFALQLYESAVSLDPAFALAYAAIANVCALYHENHQREEIWMERAKNASQKALELKPGLPEAQVAKAWLLYANKNYEEAIRSAKAAIEKKKDSEGAYYILSRAMFASDRWQELIEIMEAALDMSGDDYSIYVPFVNALGALGKTDQAQTMRQRRIQALEKHLKVVPEDARARTLLACDYAALDRKDDAIRETQIAEALRPNDAALLYNVACIYCMLKKKKEALESLAKSWNAGFKDANWARRDPDLSLLHGEPEFEQLYPASAASD